MELAAVALRTYDLHGYTQLRMVRRNTVPISNMRPDDYDPWVVQSYN